MIGLGLAEFGKGGAALKERQTWDHALSLPHISPITVGNRRVTISALQAV